MKISIIVAQSSNKVIGKGNQLPWHLPADLQRFRKLTTGHHILMGRKTYESIGKPLPNRVSIVVSRDANYNPHPEVKIISSIEQGLELARQAQENELFIIGGGEIYRQTLPLADCIYLTEVEVNIEEGDAFFPPHEDWKVIDEKTFQADEKNHFRFTFKELIKK